MKITKLQPRGPTNMFTGAHIFVKFAKANCLIFFSFSQRGTPDFHSFRLIKPVSGPHLNAKFLFLQSKTVTTANQRSSARFCFNCIRLRKNVCLCGSFILGYLKSNTEIQFRKKWHFHIQISPTVISIIRFNFYS